MLRIDGFKESDNPDQTSNKSNAFEKTTTPVEADKQKLERTEDTKQKYSYRPEKNDFGKDKLSDKPSYAYHWDGNQRIIQNGIYLHPLQLNRKYSAVGKLTIHRGNMLWHV